MMARSLLAVLLLLVLPAAAQHVGGKHERHHRKPHHSHKAQHLGKSGHHATSLTAQDRITLTARGEAAMEPNALKKALKKAGKKHQKKAITHPKQFKQLVNGSTPTGWIKMGNPPKWILVIFDTGSDLLVAKTWDTVLAELVSIDQGISGMVLPSPQLYDHASSTSYKAKYQKDPDSGKMVLMRSEISYGSGSAITDEGNDTIKVGHFELEKFPISEVTQDSLQMLHTSAGISGVFGLQHMKNRSAGSSFFTRLRDSDQATAFGYCRGTGDNGTFIWGDQSTEGKEVPVLGQIHWAVKVGEMAIHGPTPKDDNPAAGSSDDTNIITRIIGDDSAGEGEGGGLADPLAALEPKKTDDSEGLAAAKMCGNSTHGGCIAIMDTGSNILAGPTSVMTALSNKMNVAQDCSNFDKLPNITFTLGTHNFTVEPQGYVMKIPMPTAGMGGGGDFGMEEPDGAEGGDGQGGFSFDEVKARRVGQKAKARAKTGWKEVFAHLKKHRGIDLQSIVGDIKVNNGTTDAPAFLCMPALVPLDKQTKFGPLYIVGTPLLQTYYARWSWPKHHDDPKMYFHQLSDSTTCKDIKADYQHSPHVDNPIDDVSEPSLEAVSAQYSVSPLMRSERPAQPSMPSLKTEERGKGPFIRNIEDISYPHWAMLLDEDTEL